MTANSEVSEVEKRKTRRKRGGGDVAGPDRKRARRSEREEKRNSEGPCGVSRDIKSYYVYAMPPPKYSLLRYRVFNGASIETTKTAFEHERNSSGSVNRK